MGKVKKVVLDTAEFHPLHRNWLNLAQTIAKELGVDLDVKTEDYVYAISYGDKDDLGMAWLPQLFLEMEDGSVKLVMSQYPFDPATTKPSDQMALDEARKKVQEILKDL
ncbi:MAG: hypothetical protein ACP5HK_00645 [Acidilobus sp.]